MARRLSPRLVSLPPTMVEPSCDYSDPSKKWVGKSVDECALVLFTCVEGTKTFSNTCGCGCETN